MTITQCLKRGSLVPRSLLKNGKRDRPSLEASRSQTVQSSQATHSGELGTPFNATQPSNQAFSEQVRSSTILCEINNLKEEVKSLKRDLFTLYQQNSIAEP